MHEESKRDEAIAGHWDGYDTTIFFAKETYWRANPLVERRYHEKATGGRDYPHWVNFCIDHHFGDRKPVDRILNIGCGDGDLERHLVSLDAARVIEGVDIAPKRIENARRAAEAEGLGDRIRYFVANIEKAPLPSPPYDAIFFDSSLHHMFDLEKVLAKCAAALKPEGFLFCNEYIGPNRFALGEREKEAVEGIFFTIPERYRISHAEYGLGLPRREVFFPDPFEVERDDPSESVRSEDIARVIGESFEILELNFAGGTLLHFLLEGIAGNFREEDPDSVRVLELLFQAEDTLVEIGDLPPHFALIVAKPASKPDPEKKGLVSRLFGRILD